MNKFALIALYALVVTFSIQYLFPSQKNIATTESNILLTIADDTIVIPNIPLIEVVNKTASGFILSPCKDIKITIDSQPLTDIEKVSPGFCNTVTVWPSTTHIIHLDTLSKVFASRAGKYTFSLSTPIGDRITTFTVSEPSGIRSFLTTTIYKPIYNLFVALLTFLPGHSLGWAIVIITLIVRIILLVPQHHMLESQKKLQVIQPKIKELQKKYKDDQSKLGMEMLELYKKEKVNPMGSCLPLLIQMPILIGLYWVISGISDSSNLYHLYDFFRSFAPANIDAHFLGLNLLQIGWVMAIVFGISLAILQYIQAKLSFAYQDTLPKKEEKKIEKVEWAMPDMALDPEMMKKMMLYIFPLMIGVSAYFFPLGVGLYWFIGTLFVIAQQAYVNRKK
jgi:YidC/Oxa1 family membrane protein insertase